MGSVYCVTNFGNTIKLTLLLRFCESWTTSRTITLREGGPVVPFRNFYHGHMRPNICFLLIKKARGVFLWCFLFSVDNSWVLNQQAKCSLSKRKSLPFLQDFAGSNLKTRLSSQVVTEKTDKNENPCKVCEVFQFIIGHPAPNFK